MKFKDYYETLGVARDVDAQELKRAYRRLARKYHPDVSTEPNAELQFRQVLEAYEVLKDANKRNAYDNLGAGWQDGQEFNPPPQWSSFFRDGGRSGPVEYDQFSEFFETLFGNEHESSRAENSDMPGADEQLLLGVSLEDAYNGAQRTLHLEPAVAHASGEAQRNLKVKIPVGVTQGQRIRMAGQGRPGPGGRRGDLFLTVELQPHKQFKLRGRDVYMVLPITPWEAALGGNVKSPTLGGHVDLKIPAGSNSGRKLRIRGRGLGQGENRGDQYVELQVHTPVPQSDADLALYRKFAQQMNFDPRQS